MTSPFDRVRGASSFLLLFAVAVFAFPVLAEAKDRKALRKADRQMSGVVASVGSAGGMFTVRLDNGDLFSAPIHKVRVRQVQKNEDRATTGGATPRRSARMHKLATDTDSVPVGSRVIVNRKLDRDGNLKRVTVRILGQ
jgi:hypothetical protein